MAPYSVFLLWLSPTDFCLTQQKNKSTFLVQLWTSCDWFSQVSVLPVLRFSPFDLWRATGIHPGPPFIYSIHPAVRISDFIPSCLLSSLESIHRCLVVRNLGVTFGSCLKFDEQISLVVWTSFCRLQLLTKVKPFISRGHLEKDIHASAHGLTPAVVWYVVGMNQTSSNRLQHV